MENKERLLKVIIDNKLGKELAQLLYDTKKDVFDELKRRFPITLKDEIKEMEKHHLSTLQKIMKHSKINPTKGRVSKR